MADWQKLDLLGEAAQYDVCRECGGTGTARIRDDLGRWIYPAVRPDGRRIALLKVLQTNLCKKDCAYCANRSGRDTPRSSLTPDELSRAFSELASSRRAQGLFLSSGVWGHANRSMERMLASAEIIRGKYQFGGYMHIKILPGADDACIEAAMRLGNRVSVNLEAPNASRIGALSSTKDFRRELLDPLRRAHRLRRQLGLSVSLATQFVVGGAEESDRELLTTASWLYGNLRLARTYYSAFQPISDTPLQGHAATPAWREHRLYQADFLLRQYGFLEEEMVYDSDGNLPRSSDPKLLWAQHHPEAFPIEVNTASHKWLLRVPGIGPTYADEILRRRREGRLLDLAHLGISPASARRAAPFILLGGKRPVCQLPLF